MTGTAFIKMMREDVETHKDKGVLLSVVQCMEHVVNLHPGCNIDGQKTAEACYKKIYEYAKNHKNGNYAVVIPEKSMEIVAEYLGLPLIAEPTPTAGLVSLDDFFTEDD